MELAFLGLLAFILACSVAGGLLTTWSLHRRALKTEYRVNDIEERLTSVGARAKANKRWERQKSLEEEIEEFQEANAAPISRQPRAKFDNDPLDIHRH